MLSNFWHGLIPVLYACAALPQPHSRFRPVYRFNTEKGPFYIAEFKKRFYLLYKDEESFGSYATPEKAAEGVELVSFLTLKVDFPAHIPHSQVQVVSPGSKNGFVRAADRSSAGTPIPHLLGVCQPGLRFPSTPPRLKVSRSHIRVRLRPSAVKNSRLETCWVSPLQPVRSNRRSNNASGSH
jgi:hypothetical protein